MKKIVLFGAFDRYNYGDNLMPVLFQLFVEKYARHIFNDFEFEYVAISSSNLEKYSCYKTISINSIVNTLPSGSVIVVVGGEVLCCRNQSLFLHMQNSQFHHFFLKVFKKLLPRIFNWYAKSQYATYWEFPFIPLKSFFAHDIKVVFNTVGGDMSNLTQDELNDIKERIISSDYFSVRDKRTFNSFKSLGKETVLAPDSAYIMSDIINAKDLTAKISEPFLDRLPKSYFVFQAAPTKIGYSVKKCIFYIQELSKQAGQKVVLLPIGYASGHDDLYLLQKVHKALPENTVLLHNLTLWEIMYVIMKSKIYFGTSLHGAITAMSYSVPHFGLNRKITKLDEFLKDWSVYPFHQCYPLEDMAKLPALITDQNIANLTSKTTANIGKVKANYEQILQNIDNPN